VVDRLDHTSGGKRKNITISQTKNANPAISAPTNARASRRGMENLVKRGDKQQQQKAHINNGTASQ
jgi:hypothetical protein